MTCSVIHEVTVSFKTLRLAKYSFSLASESSEEVVLDSPFDFSAGGCVLAPKEMLNAFEAGVVRAPKPAKPENTFFLTCRGVKQMEILNQR